MSETNATPTPVEATSPTQVAESPSGSAPMQGGETNANASSPEAKRKRKRRRKRNKGVGTAAVPATAETGETGETPSGEPISAAPQPAQKPKQASAQTKKRGRGQEPPRKHRRDVERPLRTQEQLASWRWSPTNAQMRFFPPLTQPSNVGTDPTPPAQAMDATSSGSTGASGSTGSSGSTGPSASASTSGSTGPSGSTATAEPEEPEVSAAAESNGPSPSADESASEADPRRASEEPNAEQPLPAQRPAVGHEQTRQHPQPRWGIPTGDALEPWLTATLERCPAADRAALLVSLCSHRTFRQQLGRLSEALESELRPLAAVYDAVFLDTAPTVMVTPHVESAADEQPAPQGTDGRETLLKGLEVLSQGGVELLRAWPLAARERLNELAEDFELVGNLQRDIQRLFFDVPKLVGRLGLRAICDALSHGDDAQARELIKTVGSQPGVPGLLPMLTEALDGQRFGSLVILSYGGAQSRGPDPKAPKRHSGFCLESQRDVWIRTGESQDAGAFEHYSQVQRRALLPGVVGLYAFGVTRSRKPYAAVLRKGISLQRRLAHGWGLQRYAAVALATELTLLSSGLCRAGLRLPDLDARRFELDEDGRLWVSDLWGAELMEPRAQDNTAVSICRETVVNLLANQPGFLLPADWREVLSHSADFETIVATLRKLEKSRFWRN